jgi:predicted ATP-dependent endonuclease of OLD family
MQYKRFIIANYKAISGPLEINVAANPLIPIIGVNECGKTTILSAIFAFDMYSDDLNDGRHLKDVDNLYDDSAPTPTITAEIVLSAADFTAALEAVETKHAETAPTIASYRRKRKRWPKTLHLQRELKNLRYSILADAFSDPDVNHLVGSEIVRKMPYILYFDDFRDSIDETIEIKGDPDDVEGWLSILERLFEKTNPDFSVFKLADLDDRRRKSVLAKVQRELNNTLTKEWQNFRLDDSDALEIAIEFNPESSTVDSRGTLKLEIIETDDSGDKHYFFVRDRSKGFFWFFNFVMKLEFNPKLVGDKSATIYLLDEPGSYLHASAQSRLCRKLRNLSRDNRVIYCTHSHYLLDPEVIPLSTIRVAEKSASGSIELIGIHEHKGNILERRSAFQPVIDALQIKPVMLDWNAHCTIIVEGIYDYYALQLFRQNRNINIIPSSGADSIRYYISLAIAAQFPYRALWDNDSTGKREFNRAIELFGEAEADKRFFLLPSNGKDRILQDLFEGEDLRLIRTNLGIPDASFEKTIASLHFAPEKAELLGKLSSKTRHNFARLYDYLGVRE